LREIKLIVSVRQYDEGEAGRGSTLEVPAVAEKKGDEA
jgi:hypothetical protein